jgi:ribulose-phosphate 3-epimerase
MSNSNVPYVIAVSILGADFAVLKDQIAEAEANGAGWVHIDVMDGHFVPNLSMGPVVVEACKRSTSLPLDVHLMIENPEKYLEAFASAGADHISVHVEATQDLPSTLQAIQQLGCKAGVAINPETPATAIEPVLPLADIVLVMSVHPGYSGQAFIPEVLPKMSAIRQKLDEINSPAVIEADGGVNEKTLPLALEAGAQVFVAAKAVFGHPDGIAAGMAALKAQFAG